MAQQRELEANTLRTHGLLLKEEIRAAAEPQQRHELPPHAPQDFAAVDESKSRPDEPSAKAEWLFPD